MICGIVSFIVLDYLICLHSMTKRTGSYKLSWSALLNQVRQTLRPKHMSPSLVNMFW
jgi:hypothetical protein